MYIRIVDNQIEFYSIGQLRRDNPQISFPNTISNTLLAEFNVFPLKQIEKPEPHFLYEKVIEDTPIEINGVWTQKWTTVQLTEPEINNQKQKLVQSIVEQTQKRLDDFARTRQYDGILSLCTYATSTIEKFQLEGQYGVDIRDATWALLYQLLAEVEAGNRDIPLSYEDIESELPPLEWPNS
jgi:hypothetical protein